MAPTICTNSHSGASIMRDSLLPSGSALCHAPCKGILAGRCSPLILAARLWPLKQPGRLSTSGGLAFKTTTRSLQSRAGIHEGYPYDSHRTSLLVQVARLNAESGQEEFGLGGLQRLIDAEGGMGDIRDIARRVFEQDKDGRYMAGVRRQSPH